MRGMLRSLVLFAVVLVTAPGFAQESESALLAPLNVVEINFDPPQFPQATGFDPQPLDFLKDFGIPNIVVGGTGPNAGPPGLIDPDPHIPASAPQVMAQTFDALDSGQSHSLTFHFDPPLLEFALSRMGTAASGNSIPAWKATFFEGNTELGSFGEPYTVGMLPVEKFTFSAPEGTEITSMELSSTWTSSTFRNILVDDFVLTSDPFACPATRALELVERSGGALQMESLLGAVGKGTALNLVRRFRDQVLKETPAGEELVGLYYSHSEEMSEIIAAHPEVAFQTARVIARLLVPLREAERANVLRLDRHTYALAMELADAFEAYGSEQLRRALVEVRASWAPRIDRSGQTVVIRFSSETQAEPSRLVAQDER